ncbi:hypothetical protein BDB00DRAFT_849943 [Zychaea mexicana]|uniref:uncharacterized protein n=1 Tax=Zychaea mexicana TaxID=64656 RepID=UPI0022FED9F7|nr:uncharacterized protein BDB00DRAFT_849943 [Zychaea mexicana]KAI9488089.1 hypothetical protein BDB00DRAFT_849943 [Zychaea mexicana]
MPTPREIEEFTEGDKGFGIIKATEFSLLKSFHGHTFFGLDELHLIGANCTRKIWSMISREYANVDCTIELSKQACSAIAGDSIVNSLSTIPSSEFEGSFSNVDKKGKFMRAVDWVVFMQFVLPTLVFEQLVSTYGADSSQVVAIMSYVIGCSLALRWEIDQDDLDRIRSNLDTWHMHLKTKVTHNMYTVNFHLLRHIPATIEALGPLRGYSTRSAERAIGFFEKHVKSRVSPGANAGNIIKRQLLMRNFERVYNPEDFLQDQPQESSYYTDSPKLSDYRALGMSSRIHSQFR